MSTEFGRGLWELYNRGLVYWKTQGTTATGSYWVMSSASWCNQPESSKKAQFVANIYALLFDQETKTEDIKEDDLIISYLQGEATDTTNEV